MDYPKPSMFNNKNTENIDNTKIENLKNERELLIPKIKPIDFTDKKTNKDNDTIQLYNELLTNYNTQVDDMTKFDNNQKDIKSIN